MEFLTREIPFYAAGESLQLPPGAQGTTVLDHVRAAVAHLVNVVGTGEHGLIRIGDGDWSDAIVFETVTRIGGVLFPAWFENSKQHGESVPNTLMALHVLPQTIALLQAHDPELVEQIWQFVSGLEAAAQRQWSGRWYSRAILRDPQNKPVILDNTRINLESQVWALISGAAQRNGCEETVIHSVATLLDDPSPTGAPFQEDEQIWPAISQLLTWGYCRSRPNLAWRSLLRHTFAAHAAVFPDLWINTWSGPDAVYCKASAVNPGGTWQSPATPMTDFPVMNCNPHAMALLGLLRICGIEPSGDGQGLVIAPQIPRERFTLDTALRRALVDHVPAIHHSDQGWQYACSDYTDLLTEYEVQISMAAVGKPEENGYAQRLMRTLKEEEVDLSEYDDFHEGYRSIGRFLEEVYTHKRIHSALGYLTPAEFEADWQPEPVLK